MPRHTSLEIRQRMVIWHDELGKPTSEIAQLAGCSERTAREVLRLHRTFGTVQNPLARPRGGPRSLNMADITYLTSLLDANPSRYLDELQVLLRENRDIEVSIATICRTLQRVSLTRKHVAATAAQRNELLRATWQAEYGDIPAHYFVWLDESSVDGRTSQRTHGYAPLGRACVRRAEFIRGQRFSILPALTSHGMIALDIFEGSVTKERFINFIREQVAPELTPYPGPRSVVVLDNCAIHHNAEVQQMIVHECGAKLIYLPPYSPDFNPIEQAFHSIKAWLRRHEAEALQLEARPWLIHQAAMAVTSEMAEGWILNCGYSFE